VGVVVKPDVSLSSREPQDGDDCFGDNAMVKTEPEHPDPPASRRR
jgi:hypothetical protein